MQRRRYDRFSASSLFIMWLAYQRLSGGMRWGIIVRFTYIYTARQIECECPIKYARRLECRWVRKTGRIVTFQPVRYHRMPPAVCGNHNIPTKKKQKTKSCYGEDTFSLGIIRPRNWKLNAFVQRNKKSCYKTGFQEIPSTDLP